MSEWCSGVATRAGIQRGGTGLATAGDLRSIFQSMLYFTQDSHPNLRTKGGWLF
ncbi:MAG: hypothetical protein KME26_18960 [Oscillatoria princeps RMCB-10]|nr:hypothetical protein [Oscillatoria princeps RMCB-10]